MIHVMRCLETLVRTAERSSPLSFLLLRLPCVADKLGLPWVLLLRSPQMIVPLALALYLIFLFIWGPLYVVSCVVTNTGAVLCASLGVWKAGKELTVLLSYPGKSRSLQSDITKEYGKSVTSRLISYTNCVRMWLQLVCTTDALPNGMPQYRTLSAEVQHRALSAKGDMHILCNALQVLVQTCRDEQTHQVPQPSMWQRLLAWGRRCKTARSVGGAARASTSGESASAALLDLSEEGKHGAAALLAELSELRRALEQALNQASTLVTASSVAEFDARRRELLQGARRNGIGGMGSSSSSSTSISSSTSSSSISNGGALEVGKGSGGSEDFSATLQQAETAVRAVLVQARLLCPKRKEAGVFPLTQLKAWWESNFPSGCPVSLDLMRNEMLGKYSAEQVWLTMSDGVLLDCCHVPARRPAGVTAEGQRAAAAAATAEAAAGGGGGEVAVPGCVLFCNPNAGFSEALVASGHGEGDWVTFYTSLGCDAFLFNYRGYARSQGRPSPSRINQDVIEIATYLREHRGVKRLALHGESIGGMAAANAARHAEVDLLVLDRTFGSLTGAAQRLIGAWTDSAIRAFTQWTTDVALDYLACRCPKVVACDPDDSIIPDPASLKAAVAVRLELGPAATIGVLPLPYAYALADHLASPPPLPRGGAAAVPHVLSHDRLSEAQVVHFSCCLRYVALTASAKIKSARVQQRTAEWSRKSLLRERTGTGSSSGSGWRATDGVEAGEGMGGGSSSSSSSGSASIADAEGIEMVRLNVEGTSADYQTEEEEEEDEERVLLDVDDGSGGPAAAAALKQPVVELWTLLARANGLSGRLLGAAVANGGDHVRAWVCSLLVWGPHIGQDDILNSPAGIMARRQPKGLPVEQVLAQAEHLIETNPLELGPEDNAAYIVGTLRYVCQRLSDARAAVDATTRQQQQQQQQQPPPGHLSDLHDEQVLGRLLPLRCGHNNPYHPQERDMLRQHLQLNGWVSVSSAYSTTATAPTSALSGHTRVASVYGKKGGGSGDTSE